MIILVRFFVTTNSTESQCFQMAFLTTLLYWSKFNWKTHFVSKETINLSFEIFMIFYSFEICTFFQLVKNSAALTSFGNTVSERIFLQFFARLTMVLSH